MESEGSTRKLLSKGVSNPRLDQYRYINIGTYNPRSISNKIVDVVEYLKDRLLDVALIQESWLNDYDSAKLFEIEQLGYKVMSSPRKSRGGGLAVLHKSTLKLTKNCKIMKFKTMENMEATLKASNELIRFVNIYRPQYSKKHPYTENDFLSELDDYLCNLNLKPGITIIMGDFNLHIQKKDNLYTVLLNKLFDEYSIEQIVPHKPTHRDGNTLDLILVSQDTAYKFTNVEIDNQITHSDHYLVQCIFQTDVKLQDHPTKYLEYRKYSSINLNDFKSDIKNSGLQNLEQFKSADEACVYYQFVLKELLDKHCPVIKRKLLHKHEPWFDEELRDLRRKRRRAERLFRKVPSSNNKKQYNSLCKEMTQLIKSKRKSYTSSSVQAAHKNKKSLYGKINELLGKSKPLPDCPDDEKLAENFRGYFSEKIDRIRKVIIEDQEKSSLPYSDVSYAEASCELHDFIELTKNDLLRIVNDLPNKNSPHDLMPNWLLKECFEQLCPMLLFIVNKSITDAEFPSSLKHACVIPTIKDSKADHDLLSNYRPISNLLTLSKILEKSICYQLSQYLSENDLHSEFQSGYRKGHSCETLLLKISNDMVEEAENNNLIAMVLLDLSAAFDAIDHSILLKKLEIMFGIKSSSLKWLKSYLSNRSFSVRINKSESGIEIILYGVPQGSILGPILFILYTKDLADIILKYGIKLRMYADDSTLYLKFDPAVSSDINIVKEKLEACLKEVKSWMVTNYMKLNEDKTKLIIFGKPHNLKKHSFNMNLNFNGNIVKNLDLSAPNMTKEGKSLGVFLSNDLSMKRQISAVKKSCFNVLYSLRNVKQFLTEEIKLLLIKSLVISKLDFCNSLYMNIPQYLLNILHRLMNYCVRFIYNVPKSVSATQCYFDAHILPIHLRIKFKCSLIVHNCIHGTAPHYLKSLFQLDDSSDRYYNLRITSEKIRLRTIHTARTSVFATRCLSMYGPVIWNELSESLRCCVSSEDFKKQLKTYLFNIFEEETKH